MANTTSSPWQRNLTTTLLNSVSTEDLGGDTQYEGNGLGDWPYFSISGHAYWAGILIVVSLGLVGNALATRLMSNSQFSLLSYPVYLIWLAMSDSIVLIIKLVEETQQNFHLHQFLNDSAAICKIWLYIRYTTFLLSPWLVFGLTLDRFVCVLFPLTRNMFCTRKKGIIVCSGLTLISAIIQLPFLVGVNLFDGQCHGPHNLYYQYIVVRMLLSSTLPCFLILIFNIAIIVRVQRSAVFRKLSASASSSSSSKDQDKTTRPLVMVSVSAFVTLLPLSVTECVEVLLNITGMDLMAMVLAIKLWPLFNIIYLMNFGQNFYVLMASSANYRKIMAPNKPPMTNEARCHSTSKSMSQ